MLVFTSKKATNELDIFKASICNIRSSDGICSLYVQLHEPGVINFKDRFYG